MKQAPTLLASVIALVVLAVPYRAHAADAFFNDDAETPSPISDFFSLRASFYHANVSTQLRLDPGGEPDVGTHLTGTTDLGFKPSENDGLAELMFRLRDRNRIIADYQELDQSGTTVLTRPIVFGSQVFSGGDLVSTSLQWRVMGLTYTYAFIQNDRFELAAGLGLHIMDVDVRASDPVRFASYETSTTGAVPTPALESVWRMTRRFSLTARAEYLKGTLNETFGKMGEFHADVQFRIVPNLSLGAGYSVLTFEVNSLTHDSPDLASFRLRGPEAFVRASF